MSLEYYDDWFDSGSHYDFGFTNGGGGGGGGGWDAGGGIVIDFPPLGGGGGGGGGAPSLNQTLTQIVDSYEYQLKGNLANWGNNLITAEAAISEGWKLINGMVSACLAYGAAGSKAAAERDRRINPAQLRWDWVAYYIDPITGGNTTLPPVPGGGVNITSGQFGGNNQTMLLIGLAVLLYLATKD